MERKIAFTTSGIVHVSKQTGKLQAFFSLVNLPQLQFIHIYSAENVTRGDITIIVRTVVINPSVGATWPALVIQNELERQKLEDFINRHIYSLYSTIDWRIETFTSGTPLVL